MVVPLLLAGFGVMAGAGIVVAGVATQEEQDLSDSLEPTMIRIGYVSEGILKGSLVAIPTSLFVLLAFEAVMRMKSKVGV